MGGEGPPRRFHAPSARHSQTFPPRARPGGRLTRPGCGREARGWARSRGAGAAEAPGLRSGFPGTSWAPGAGGRGEGRERGLAAGGGPLRVRAPPGGGAGPGESRPRRVRAASIPAALRAQQTMNLRARRAQAAGPGLRGLPRPPALGGPSPPALAALPQLRAGDPSGRAGRRLRRGSHAPSPAGENAAGAGDGTWRRGGGAAEAGGLRGAHAGAAHAGLLTRKTVPGVAPPLFGSCGQKTDGQTDWCFHLASALWAAVVGSRGTESPQPGALLPRALRGSFQARAGLSR